MNTIHEKHTGPGGPMGPVFGVGRGGLGGKAIMSHVSQKHNACLVNLPYSFLPPQESVHRYGQI